MSDDRRSAWIARVLGVTIDGGDGSGHSGSTIDWPSIRAEIDAAMSTVDGQILKLQDALRHSGDEALEEVAEYGMNGITGNHRVRLMALMMELDQGGEAIRTTGPALAKLAGEFKDYLDSDERVEVCDDNPLGVTVSIRTTLGGALARMAAALQQQVRV